MGAGGVIPPPAGYFAAIAPVCAKYDLYLISDEVITAGSGRMFGGPVVPCWPRAADGPDDPSEEHQSSIFRGGGISENIE
jgi:hypothetical protein